MVFEALRKPHPVVILVDQSSPVLTAMLSNQLKLALLEAPTDASLNPERFFLSEMGLCGVIHKLNLPKGYHPVHGKVYFYGSDTIYTKHEFAMSGDNIICITPGQFIEPDNSFQKGDRIRMLLKRNPRHIVVDGELAVLFGKIDTIEGIYGFRYATR